MQLASKPGASHEHIIFSLKEYKVSLREPWLLWATFLFRLSVPIMGKPHSVKNGLLLALSLGLVLGFVGGFVGGPIIGFVGGFVGGLLAGLGAATLQPHFLN